MLVRVKNEIAALPAFWTALEQQTIFRRIEIIFMDSGSTDGTIEFLRSKPCDLYYLKGEFNFGRSCNQIASLSKAQILVFLSGHVLLAQNDALEQIAELLEHAPFGAAYFRQVPNHTLGCNAYEIAHLRRRFPSGEGIIRLHRPGAFSNAASAIARAAWERQPFMEIAASEDFVWASQHLNAGGDLFYLPQLRVMHSHNETPEGVYRRVRMNVEARHQTKSYAKAIYVFAGVYISMLRIRASHSEALNYARAHGSAYL